MAEYHSTAKTLFKSRATFHDSWLASVWLLRKNKGKRERRDGVSSGNSWADLTQLRHSSFSFNNSVDQAQPFLARTIPAVYLGIGETSAFNRKSRSQLHRPQFKQESLSLNSWDLACQWPLNMVLDEAQQKLLFLEKCPLCQVIVNYNLQA